MLQRVCPQARIVPGRTCGNIQLVGCRAMRVPARKRARTLAEYGGASQFRGNTPPDGHGPQAGTSIKRIFPDQRHACRYGYRGQGPASAEQAFPDSRYPVGNIARHKPPASVKRIVEYHGHGIRYDD